METPLENKLWWSYIEADLQELLKEAFLLSKMVKSWGGDLPRGKEIFHDYSFIVFPAAKAYEGYLKKVFLDSGFITEEDYFGKHFRIGKSLNPSLPKKIRKEGVYDKIVVHCGGKALADYLWETWRLSRNLTFHWFPDEKNALTLDEANDRLGMIIKAFDMLYKECKMSQGN